MKNRRSGRAYLPFLGGLALGVLLTGAGGIAAMRSLMIVEYESPLSFDATVSAMEQAVIKNGWSSPGTMNLNKSLAKHGVRFGPRVRLVQLCKAPYAAKVLEDAREMATMMPCRFAVYEGPGGKVRIAKLNTGLMGKLFGGTVAEVMGGKVAADEQKMLDAVLEKAVPK
jgi:uncharacterized protein (DUF302 family)